MGDTQRVRGISGDPGRLSNTFVALVSGVCWYEDRRGDAHCLPAHTAVPGSVALAPSGPQASYLRLALPSGTADVEARAFPLTPVSIDRVFPLRSASIDWQPERPEHGVVDLSQDWRMLFWERQAFMSWGDASPAFAWALRTYERIQGPRPTFRAGADRRHMRFIFPQVVPPNVCYRLSPAFAELPQRNRLGIVVAEGDLTLRGPDGWTASAGNDALGWRVVVRRGQEDPQTARHLPEAVDLLAAKGIVWQEVATPQRRLLATP